MIKNLFAAEGYAKLKCEKVALNLVNTNYVFVPVIGETFGSWTDSSVNFINSIVGYYAARQKLTLPEAKGRIWTKIGILLQKANAYAIQMRMPHDLLY
jgi:hypothetical protein